MKTSLPSLFFAVATGAALLLSGCGKPAPEAPPAPTEPPKPLVMITEAQFPPYEYVEDGKIVGVDVDICQAIADALGRPFIVNSTNFDMVVDVMLAGKADLAAAGLTVTEERKEIVDFSMPYATSGIVIVSRKGNEFKDVASAQGRRVGVQSGTTSDQFCSEELGVAPVRFDGPLQAAAALREGKLDLVILDSDPAHSIVGKDPDLVIASDILCREEFAIAVRKGDTELLEAINTTLSELLKAGKVKASIAAHTARCAEVRGK